MLGGRGAPGLGGVQVHAHGHPYHLLAVERNGFKARACTGGHDGGGGGEVVVDDGAAQLRAALGTAAAPAQPAGETAPGYARTRY